MSSERVCRDPPQGYALAGACAEAEGARRRRDVHVHMHIYMDIYAGTICITDNLLAWIVDGNEAIFVFLLYTALHCSVA
jgi:hypothetical protein